MAFSSFPIDTVEIHQLPDVSPSGASHLPVSVGGVAGKVNISALAVLLNTLLPEDSTLTTVVSADGVLDVGKTYYFDDDYEMTLPDPTLIPPGKYMTLLKKRGVFPSISVNGALGEKIQTDNGDDTEVVFDVDKRVTIVWDGADWNCLT